MAGKQKMSVAKKITIILASILAVIMLGICVWWMIIYFAGPQKIVSTTYNVGTITTADGSTTKNVIEVKYMSNKKKNGYEMLDIRYNYFHDEERNEIYSQGLQYVTNNVNDKLSFEFLVDENQKLVENYEKREGSFLWGQSKYYHDGWGTYVLNDDTGTTYNYASTDDYYTTLNSANPLNVNSRFKIQVGEDMYQMGFKGYRTPKGNEFIREEAGKSFMAWGTNYNDYYIYYSFDYFAMVLYDALQTGEYGMDHAYIMELPDMFDYYKCTDAEGAVYEEQPVGTEAASKLIREVRNYYSIKITISEDGAQSSEDSLFGAVHGNRNYNAHPDRATDDYFAGRSIIDCTFNNFDYVLVNGNQVALKLKEAFIQLYLPYKSSIKLDVLIDKDEIKKMGYEYFGFAEDNGLDNFSIYRVRTVENQNGDPVYSEVQL